MPTVPISYISNEDMQREFQLLIKEFEAFDPRLNKKSLGMDEDRINYLVKKSKDFVNKCKQKMEQLPSTDKEILYQRYIESIEWCSFLLRRRAGRFVPKNI